MNITEILKDVNLLINKTTIRIYHEDDVEISCHYGIDKFAEYGTTIITKINRLYCKKYIVSLAHQCHPHHYHKIKEESFELLYGGAVLWRIKNSIMYHDIMIPGKSYLIEPNTIHSFVSGPYGAIIEEVSTHHYDNDSYYEDESISNRPREERKIKIQ